jgi:hypothetical protein
MRLSQNPQLKARCSNEIMLRIPVDGAIRRELASGGWPDGLNSPRRQRILIQR